MNTLKILPEVTAELLGRFSPHLQSIRYDFGACSLQFQLFDDVERPRRLRVLTFNRVRELQVAAHDPADVASNCLDGVIGMHHAEDEYYVHTVHYAISFRCGSLTIHEREI